MEHIIYQLEEDLAILTLNRPEAAKFPISRRTTDLDKRNSGIPNKSTPPGSD